MRVNLVQDYCDVSLITHLDALEMTPGLRMGGDCCMIGTSLIYLCYELHVCFDPCANSAKPRGR